jgi:hypothetical protein
MELVPVPLFSVLHKHFDLVVHLWSNIAAARARDQTDNTKC